MKHQPEISLIGALAELEQSKGIPRDVIFDALESALLSACKKNYAGNLHFRVDVNREDGTIHTFIQKEVVEGEPEDPRNEISLKEALTITPAAVVGSFVDFPVQPLAFGHMAMQTAKQIIQQRVTEAERAKVYDRYASQENQMITATVQKADKDGILLVLDSGDEAYMYSKEQLPGEIYTQGMRLKFYMLETSQDPRKPQVSLSRRHPGLVSRLFEQEVPEIADGLVVIKGISREAGFRSKVAVWSDSELIDPIGTCVGVHGDRVGAITNALAGEHIDIIRYSDDIGEYVAAALSPAKVTATTVDQEAKTVFVQVPKNQLSLAIGKNAQNVRLAVRLTGWKIDIKPDAEMID